MIINMLYKNLIKFYQNNNIIKNIIITQMNITINIKMNIIIN